MQTFQPGDQLVTNIDSLGLAEHHGLYIGNKQVIHLSKCGYIEEIDLWNFSNGRTIRVKKSADFPKLAIEFAQSRLGSTSYRLVTNNCEQFVNECFDEQRTSNQVSNLSHLGAQTIARSGMLGQAVSKVASGTIANVVLASTVAKVAGEYIGLPDNVNTIIGTPGDLVGKPIESFVTGSTRTLDETYDCLSNGEILEAGSTFVQGTISTVAKSVIVTPIEVGVTGIKAGSDAVSDLWNWLKY